MTTETQPDPAGGAITLLAELDSLYTKLSRWTSPTGQEFTGTPEYIVGVKTGWDARVIGVRSHRQPEHHHPNDTTTQPKGEVW